MYHSISKFYHTVRTMLSDTVGATLYIPCQTVTQIRFKHVQDSRRAGDDEFEGRTFRHNAAQKKDE